MSNNEHKNREYSIKKRNKNKNKSVIVEFDDLELLRLQGLIRCDSCKTPCPNDAIICPTCNSKA